VILHGLMLLLSAGAIALLTRPWWAREDAAVARKAANVAAYKSRLVEIDNDLAAGLLADDAAEALRREAGARLLVDAEALAEEAPPRASRAWLASLLVPLLAAAWYYAAGSWRQQDLIERGEQDPELVQEAAIQNMVEGLAARLEQDPADAEGWAMLGRSYTVLGRYDAAVQAYARANALMPDGNPDWLVGEGEALAMARDRDLQGRPQQLFERALALAPAHIGALWFGGLARAQAGDYAGAQALWRRLAQLDLPDDLRAVLEARLQELGRLSGVQEAAAAETPMTVVLQLDVVLAAGFAAEDLSGRTLFVFAKAVDGPPMPLAVQKIVAPQLPLRVRLDDSMGMLPQHKLSQAERWLVTARLSSKGSVQAEAGDLEGTIEVNRADVSQPLQLLIDRRIQ
jgi:cytochrome c-type biogenesis protein CcmH